MQLWSVYCLNLLPLPECRMVPMNLSRSMVWLPLDGSLVFISHIKLFQDLAVLKKPTVSNTLNSHDSRDYILYYIIMKYLKIL